MADYYEIVIKGDHPKLAAFLSGYAAAGGLSRACVFAADSGFHVSALRERIKHHGEVNHAICRPADRAKIRSAIKKAANDFDLDFEIVEERKIARAYFHFEFDTPSRDVARKIKAVLDRLPRGVRAADYSPHETMDPDAKGAEVYTPTHDYQFCGKGVVEGDVGGVIDTRDALHEIDFTHCDEIEVHHVG